MKKIMIVGAGFLQSFVIKKAKEMGLYVISVDKDPNAIGFNYSDKAIVVDIVDKEKCLDVAKMYDIDGVLTVATDYGVITAAYIAKMLKIPGLNLKTAENIKNKFKVRNILMENKVDNFSIFEVLESIESIEKIRNKITYPLIVKPIDGSGSKGTSKVNNEVELNIAVEKAIKNSISKKALVEEFIDGTEYGIETFTINGEVLMNEIIGKKMTNAPVFAELGHFYPSDIQNSKKIKNVIENALRALDVNFGSVNMDILIKNDEVYIVDVGARMGGNLIGSHIIPIGTGNDYMKNIINASVGNLEKIVFSNSKNKHIATQILALKPGKIMELPNFAKVENKYSVRIYPNFGEEIFEYKNNLDGCGYIVSSNNDTIKDNLIIVEKVKNIINEDIVRYKNV